MPDVDLHADCPGYSEAVQREQSLRSRPFLGMTEVICGQEVQPLTLRHVLILEEIQSPFLMRLPAEVLLEKPGIVADLQNFLWTVSPHFRLGQRPGGRWRRRLDVITFRLLERGRDRFNREFAALGERDSGEIIQAVLDYVGDAYMDADTGDGSRPFYSATASLTVQLAKHYDLPVDVWRHDALRDFWLRLNGKVSPLDIPLKIALQYMRIANRQQNAEYPLENKLSDAAIQAWMKTENQKT